MAEYRPTIGIECHVQLKTHTKLFAGVLNETVDLGPNVSISPICMALPGTLPVLNEEAVVLASKAAFALNTVPQKFSKFDRKHYFYPDLPMGYQISQFEEPIILGGHVDISVNGEAKRVNITRAHIEADAGKSTHPTGVDYSLVDLNRAGAPLLEIVSEPEMHSAAEARAYAHELYLLMKHAGVSNASLFHGNIRFDVNISISKTDKLGVRAEIKNLNSFRAVEKAIHFEIRRQTEVLETGGTLIQETRGWDEDNESTFSQRTKEDAHDYRYFPDPDLPPIALSDEYINDIKASTDNSLHETRRVLSSLDLDESQEEVLLDEPTLSRLVMEASKNADKSVVKTVVNWLTVEVPKYLSDGLIELSNVSKSRDLLTKLANMVNSDKLSSSAGKKILLELLKTGNDPEDIAKTKNLLQESDETILLETVKVVLSENAKAAEDIKNGELKAISFIVGQVMKKSMGKANPQIVKELIKRELSVK